MIPTGRTANSSSPRQHRVLVAERHPAPRRNYHDPYGVIDEDERSRAGLGAIAFLTPTLMAGIRYRIKESVPQDVEGNSNALTIALHAFILDLAESRGGPKKWRVQR